MSKAPKVPKGGGDGVTKEILTVTLPQFPKADDSKAQLRAKWIQDYDKVETELLKSHLGPRDTNPSTPNRPPPTAVISLRQLPDDWELQHRSQVARQEELALERQRKLEKMKKNRNLPSNQSSPHQQGPSRDNRQASYYHAASAIMGSGPSSSGKTVGSGAVAARNRAATTDPYDSRNNMSSTLPGRSTALGLAPSSPKRPSGGGPPRVHSASVRKQPSTNPRSHSNMSNTTPTPSSRTLPSRISHQGAATADLSSPVRGVVTGSFPAERLPNAEECAGVLINLLEPPPDFRHCVTNSLAHVNINWLKHHRAGERPSANLTLETIRDDLLSNPSVNNATAINSPRSVIVMMRNGVSVEDLQVTPLEAFLKKERTIGFACVSSSLALGPGSKRHVTDAASSKSLNGSAMGGTAAATGSSFGKDTSPDAVMDPARAAALEDDTARMAAKHVEDRRVELLASLRTEYRAQCREAPLLDLVDLLQRELARKEEEKKARIRLGVSGTSKPKAKGPVDVTNSSSLPDATSPAVAGKGEATFLKDRRAKIERQLTVAKERMERQVQMATEQRKREAEAEEKRLRAEQEHAAKQQETKEEGIRRQQEAAKRLEELKNETAKRQEVFIRSLEDRQQRLQEKEEALHFARQQRQEENAMQAARKAEKREMRIANQRALQEKLKEEALQRQAEQEESDRIRREKQERERQELADQLRLSQAKAEEARVAKRALAEKHEEETKQRARERAEAAEQRLQQFQDAQAQARHEQHLADRKKQEQRQAAFKTAADKRTERNAAFVEKQLSHEDLLHQVQEGRFMNRTIAKEQERLQEDDKKVFIQRRANAVQFTKLMAISSIRNKTDKGVSIDQTRRALQQHALDEQRWLRLEKEKNEQRLYEMRVANQL